VPTYDPVGCEGKADNGESIPDHDLCIKTESETKAIAPRFTSTLCYAGLNYTCASAYNSPCATYYSSEDGSVTEEEVCPENFECVDKEYKEKTVKVCQPIEPDEEELDRIDEKVRKAQNAVRESNGEPPLPKPDYRNDVCESSFDCGWSQLEMGWPFCFDNTCARAVERK